jgi:tRNA (guanine37-N1)-methyltransferase
MRFDVLTLFPEMFAGYLSQSLLKLAIDRGLVDVRLVNIRDWATGKHKSVDDRPFGGGPGMVLRVEPVVECVEAVRAAADEPGEHDPGELVMLTPQGRRLDQPLVEELAAHKRLLLLCGRYEGFDERVHEILRPREVSIGDFVLNGGEVAAMVVIDTVIRLVPGVLGDEQSSEQDSFSGGRRLLEFSQYTRPREYRGHKVPDVLLSGDHPRIADWRRRQSLERTRQRRADLLEEPLEHDRLTEHQGPTEHASPTGPAPHTPPPSERKSS